MKMNLKSAVIILFTIGTTLIAGCSSNDPNHPGAQSRPSYALDTGRSFDYALANSQIKAHLTRPSTYRVQSHGRNGSTDVVRFTYKNHFGEELRGRAFFVNMELVKLEQL